MTIELEVRDYHSADIDGVWEWKPSSDEEVYYSLEIEIGKVNETKGSLFQLIVASPEALQLRTKNEPSSSIVGRAHIIVEDYQWEKIENEINEIVRHCERETYEQSISCLERYFKWEYEDHGFVE